MFEVDGPYKVFLLPMHSPSPGCRNFGQVPKLHKCQNCKDGHTPGPLADNAVTVTNIAMEISHMPCNSSSNLLLTTH